MVARTLFLGVRAHHVRVRLHLHFRLLQSCVDLVIVFQVVGVRVSWKSRRTAHCRARLLLLGGETAHPQHPFEALQLG